MLAGAGALSSQRLAELARFADGLGPELNLVLDLADPGLRPRPLIAQAHAAGLKVHPWTGRSENNFLPPALRRFAAARPDAEVVLRELAPGEQPGALRAGRIDLALPGHPCPELEREFTLTELTRIPLQAVLPDNHRLARRRRIALAELGGEAFIGFSEETFPGRNATLCAGCQAAGFTPRFRHHVESLTALLALVAAGKGVTLAPAEVGRLPHPGAVFVPLRPPVPSVISAAARRRDDGNPLVQELLKCCRVGGASR